MPEKKNARIGPTMFSGDTGLKNQAKPGRGHTGIHTGGKDAFGTGTSYNGVVAGQQAKQASKDKEYETRSYY